MIHEGLTSKASKVNISLNCMSIDQ